MSITIQLHKFEGPLALLLHLIRKEEMDIFDIKINEITKQYLDYIKLMKELDLETAGEFIAMAATLMQIKSRMLLPQYDENGEVVENEDPRKELVQRLLEYQKYQEAAHALYERPLLGRDTWGRGMRERLEVAEEEIVLEENALFSLISAYRSALRTMKKKVHSVAKRAQSIASRIMEMKERLTVGSRVTMSEMITAVQDRRRQVLITFLSLLELGKMGFVSLYQPDTYQEIYIETLKPIEQEVMNRVEEYDSLNSDRIAAEILHENKTVDLADDDFLLPDEKDDDQLVLEAQPLDESEIATDEEILNAERELLAIEAFEDTTFDDTTPNDDVAHDANEVTDETDETSGEPEAMA